MSETKEGTMSEEKAETKKEETPRNPFTGAPTSKKWLILGAIFVGVCANLMISTTNSTVLVATAQDIGGMDIYPFASSIAGILGICIMPIYGFISSKYPASRRTVLAISLLVGALTLLLRGFAPNMPFLIACSFFWGMLSAGIFVVGYTMIRDMFDKAKTAIYIGFIGTAMSVAKLLGPVIAGALIDNIAGGWRFYNFLIGALLVIATLMVFFGVKVKKEDVAHMVRGSAKLDIAGCIAVIAFLGCLLTALNLPSVIPPGSTMFIVLLVGAAIGLVALIAIIIKKQDRALIPMSVIKDKNSVLLSLMNFFSQMSTAGILFFIPAYVMRILINDPIVTSLGPAMAGGLVTVAIGISGAILSPIFGKMISKSGSVRTVIFISVVGRVIVIVGFLLILSPTTPVWAIYILMFIAGLYNAQSMISGSTGAQIQVKSSLRAMSNSLIQLGQNLGAGIAVSVFTFLTGFLGFESGLMAGLWVCFGFTVLLFFTALPLKKLPEEESG